jgi:hypothetical protein
VARPVLHLHVGPHKTGSTYLQKALSANRDRLAAAGWLYPEEGTSGFGHHEVVNLHRGWRLPDAAGLAAGLAGLAGRGDANLLLSSENFVFLTAAQLAGLRDGFPRHRVGVSFVYRSLAEVWPSHWQELVKHGEWLPFHDYLATVLGARDRFDASVVDPLVQLEKLAGVFGRENLVVIPYNAVTDGGGDLLPAFLAAALGLELELPGGNAAVNPSLPPETIEMIRLLNERFFAEHGRLPGIGLRERYRRGQARFEAADGPGGPGGFAGFRAAFARHAEPFALAAGNPLQAAREAALLAAFGDRIAGGRGLHGAEKPARRLLAAPRHWTAAAGCGEIVAAIYAEVAQAP